MTSCWRYGVLFRSTILLEMLREQHLTEAQLYRAFPDGIFRGVLLRSVVDYLISFSLVERHNSGTLALSETGNRLLSLPGPHRIRLQIEILLKETAPHWAALACQGREALLNYVDRNIRQCFDAAELSDGYGEEVVRWWDALAARHREFRDIALTEVGRTGERLSVDYELARTGKLPLWIALDTSYVGFDLLSCVSKEDERPLVIEVKTSRRDWNSAQFVLTRHEWISLSGHPNAVVHLWSVNSTPAKRCTLHPSEIGPHVPRDSGGGEWQTVRCAFANFHPDRG